MRELSLHILDLAQNSIAANAKRIAIKVEANTSRDYLVITIEDDGKGMDEETLKRAKDPFYTTRTVRRVGLGIAMLDEAARACDGLLLMKSHLGKGTSLRAEFQLTHIDRAPLGDIAATLVSLIAANLDIDFHYEHWVNDECFEMDTVEMKKLLDGVRIDDPGVLSWIVDYVKEHTTGKLKIN